MRYFLLVTLLVVVIGCKSENRDATAENRGPTQMSSVPSSRPSEPTPSQVRLSREQAREFLQSYYANKEVTGSLTLGLLDVMPPASETEKDPMRLFQKHGHYEDVVAALDRGLVSVQLHEASFNDYYRQMNYRYRVELTNEGRGFFRERDSGTRKQVYWLKIGSYSVNDVTGVFEEGNEAKIYFKMGLQGTPFLGIATPLMRRDVDVQNTPMTAFAIHDGEQWHVKDVVEGIR